MALPFALTYFNNTWIFVKPIFIDRWIYSGFHMHLQSLLRTWGYTYYASRTPWDVLGWAVHRILPTEPALYVLHFLVFYVSAFSLYFAVLTLFSSRLAALTTVLLLATQSEFLTATGWDYVDGAYTACILVSLAAVALGATRKRYHVAAFVWGVAITTTVSLYILMLVLIPAEVVLVLLLNRMRHRHSVGVFALWVFAGICAAAIFYGCVNRLAGGPYLYFMGQILALHGVAAKRPEWFMPLHEWIGYATWLLIPLAIALMSVVVVVRHAVSSLRCLRKGTGNAESTLFVVCAAYLAACLSFVILALNHFAVLELDDKINALLPFAFVCVGGALALAARTFPNLYTVPFSIMVVAVTLLPWFLSSVTRFLPIPQAFLGLHNEIAWILGDGILLCIAAVLPRILIAPQVYMLAVILFTCIGFGGADTDMMQFVPNPYYKQGTLAVFQAMEQVQPYDRDARARFWFDNHDKYVGLERDVVSSYLYGPALINEHFPSLVSWTGETVTFRPGDRVIFLTSGSDPLARADQTVAHQRVFFQQVVREHVTRPGIDFEFIVTDVRSLDER
ncbi:MAG TPA: hypothetical protein VGG22_06340 [Candidatus Baltobacteraceae bacterium]